MPSLLGKDHISRVVKVIVTDGNSQETSQLDIAIALHFHNVCRVRCGWHVVDKVGFAAVQVSGDRFPGRMNRHLRQSQIKSRLGFTAGCTGYAVSAVRDQLLCSKSRST
jgi:hypothetical protein